MISSSSTRVLRAVAVLGLLCGAISCKKSGTHRLLLPKPAAASVAMPAALAVQPMQPVPAALDVTSTTVTQDGMGLTVSLRSLSAGLRAYSRATAQVQLRDAAIESAPLTGRQPQLWLVKQEPGAADADREGCKRIVRDILGGATALRPAAHFNHFELLTLDDNASVSIIDPLLASSKTRMVGQITLAGPAADIVAVGRDAVVSLPDHGQVVQLLVEKRRSLPYDVGGHPYDLEVLPGGGVVVAGDVTGTTLAFVDLSRTPTQVGAVSHVEVGAGPHRLAVAPQGDTLATTTAGRRGVALVDLSSRTVVARAPLSSAAVAIAWSAAAQAGYALSENGIVTRVRKTDAAVQSAPRGRGVDLAVSDDGRWLAVLRDQPASLEILDTSKDSDAPGGLVVFAAPVLPKPVRLVRSPSMVVVLHAGIAEAEALDVEKFDPKRPAGAARITVGDHGFPAAVLAPWLAPAPNDEGSFILNPADRNVYQWMEGMAAPSGSSALYPWTARGVLASDQSLREVAPGTYQTDGTLPAPGRYTAVLLARGTPQLLACTAVDIAPDLEQRDLQRVRATVTSPAGQVGVASELRVALTGLDGQPLADAPDVQMIVVQLPDFHDQPVLRKVGPSEYAATVTPEHTGPHEVMVQAVSLGLGAGKGLALRWEVHGAAAPAAPVAPVAAAAGGAGAAADDAGKGSLPDVTLIDQDGVKRRFLTDVARGKTVFFNSFFTTCGGTCPVQTSVFAALQKRLGSRVGKDIVLISVTVDPENDTPEVLKAYATKYGAGPGWYFLTGTEKDVQQVLEAMDLYAKRPDDHSPMAAVGHEPSMLWRKVLNLKAPAALEAELTALEQDVARRSPVKHKTTRP